jgi:hypothetical protein
LKWQNQTRPQGKAREFAELSAEHARKQFETFTEQTRQLTGMAQKMTADLAAPMGVGMKNALDKAGLIQSRVLIVDDEAVLEVLAVSVLAISPYRQAEQVHCQAVRHEQFVSVADKLPQGLRAR